MAQPLKNLAELLSKEPKPVEISHQVKLQHQTEWRRDLEALMSRIEGWLQELVAGGLLTPDRTEVTLREKGVDEYSVAALTLRTPGGRTIDVLPLGRWTFGAEGRVDIVAPPRRARLERRDLSATGQKEWYFVSVPDAEGNTQRQLLTQDSLAGVLQELLS